MLSNASWVGTAVLDYGDAADLSVDRDEGEQSIDREVDHRLVQWSRVSSLLVRNDTQDTGIKALVSGLAVATSKVMIASSFNGHNTSRVPGARRCHKPHSGYIYLIAEWREQIGEKDSGSVVRVFSIDL